MKSRKHHFWDPKFYNFLSLSISLTFIYARCLIVKLMSFTCERLKLETYIRQRCRNKVKIYLKPGSNTDEMYNIHNTSHSNKIWKLRYEVLSNVKIWKNQIINRYNGAWVDLFLHIPKCTDVLGKWYIIFHAIFEIIDTENLTSWNVLRWDANYFSLSGVDSYIE